MTFFKRKKKEDTCLTCSQYKNGTNWKNRLDDASMLSINSIKNPISIFCYLSTRANFKELQNLDNFFSIMGNLPRCIKVYYFSAKSTKCQVWTMESGSISNIGEKKLISDIPYSRIQAVFSRHDLSILDTQKNCSICVHLLLSSTKLWLKFINPSKIARTSSHRSCVA